MENKRSLLDDPSFNKIGAKGGGKKGSAPSGGKIILLAVLLLGVAAALAYNFGLFGRSKVPSSTTGPGATNTPEVQAEMQKQQENSRQLKERGVITESGS